MKRRGEKIVMVTAYDAPGARFVDDAGVDLILVGDSLAMVVLGHDDDAPGHDRRHAVPDAAPSRARRDRPIVVGDMPFGSYQVSDEEAVRNAIRFVKEARRGRREARGRGPSVSRARAIVDAEIPVMGHLGLTPQSATMLGGFKVQGKTADGARGSSSPTRSRSRPPAASRSCSRRCRRRSRARDHAPARGPDDRDRRGPDCDGQVLVYHDLLGLTRVTCRGSSSATPTSRARSATRSRRTPTTCAAGAFPEEQHTYSIPEERARARSRAGAQTDASRARAARARPSASRDGARARAPTSSRARHARRRRAARAPRRRTRRPRQKKTSPPVPQSAPPERKRSPPNAASPTGQSTSSESASGAQANATRCRARR